RPPQRNGPSAAAGEASNAASTTASLPFIEPSSRTAPGVRRPSAGDGRARRVPARTGVSWRPAGNALAETANLWRDCANAGGRATGMNEQRFDFAVYTVWHGPRNRRAVLAIPRRREPPP